MRTCSDVVVVASAKHAAELSRRLDSKTFPGLILVEREAGEAIAAHELHGAALVVIEVDPDSPASIDRIARIQDTPGHAPVIAAIPNASVALVRTLVRGGIDDVIGLPFAPDELLEAALGVLTSRSVKARTETRLAPMIAVVRSIGGCGATSIATHLAPALAEASGKSAVVVDLDMQFGTVADVLSAQGRGSITDLLDAGHRIDDELIRSVTRTSEDGVNVIAAPQDIVPLESVDTDQLLRVLDQLRRTYGYVVLDLPANWTNWTLSSALAADAVLLVVELSVASLRQAKRRLDLFRSVGISRDHVAVVVNRIEKRLFRTINLGDVADTLHHPALASVALDDPVVGSAQDQGRLVRALHRRSAFGSDLAKLAEALLDGPLGARS
ncbi:AAA family ATPase [Novosphingobium flavum]|uniref:AAA family ATPase n=1 Tax=Novosphingobium flavum TaxID=1778672 RepID=A0A7X1FTY3_9SPHN|nr:AAA family ATPase [Novosphingobium flavum]MBC2666292.1 AAA family ATPase [Novosphingobium flavum]